jgi:hypothetical protein
LKKKPDGDYTARRYVSGIVGNEALYDKADLEAVEWSLDTISQKPWKH